MEIKGFLPVNVPRRPGQQGLTLEKYEFVANSEDNAIEAHDKKSLVEYIQVCCTLGQRLSEMSPKVSKLKLNGYKTADDNTIDKYLKERKEEATNHVLLRVINELSALKIDDNSNIIVSEADSEKGTEAELIDMDTCLKKMFAKPENDISMDYINAMVGGERLLRPSLDLLLENSLDKNFKVRSEQLIITR